MTPLPKEFLLGPFLVKDTSSSSCPAGIQSTGYSIEFSTVEDKFLAPVFMKEQRLYGEPTMDDYCVGEDTGLPITVRFFRGIQSVETPSGTFISFGRVLGAIYEDYAPATDLFTMLKDVSERLPFKSFSSFRMKSLGLLVPKLEALGFAVSEAFSYGDSVRVELCWMPSRSKVESDWNKNVPAGVFHFRPRHDGTLGKGTCGECWECSLPFHLFERLKKQGFKNPIDCLSDQGKMECLAVFEWQPKHQLTKAELTLKRLQFVKENRQLWASPKALSISLKQEGLYSPSTSESQIAKTVKAMIESLQQGPVD